MDRNMKFFAREYANYLSKMKPRSRGAITYSELIAGYLRYLNSSSIALCVSTIMNSLGNYASKIRSDENRYLEVYEKVTKADQLLSDFEWAIDTTVKEKKYQRTKEISSEFLGIDLVAEISNNALKQSYDDAIGFFGEIAGAWILTYPIVSIRKYDRFLSSSEWATAEEDYTYILRRYLDVEINEWRR